MTMRENAAKVADAHVGEASRERQRKGFKSSAESDAEERGENIAAKLIADKIRALPDVPNPTRAALEECAEVITSLCALVSHMPIKHPQQGAMKTELLERAYRIADTARATLQETEKE